MIVTLRLAFGKF